MSSPFALPFSNKSSLPPPLPVGIQPHFSYAGIGCVLLLGLLIYTSTRPKDPYINIPVIGRTGFISSYIDGIRFIKGAKSVLQEGYQKHRHGLFRVAEMTRWHIILCGENLIDEHRKAPEDVLSLDEAAKDYFAADYTIGPDLSSASYHFNVVRYDLTRNLARIFPEMHEEMVLSFGKYIPVTDDWKSLKALDTIRKIISQTTNRIFVGEPTCRDMEFVMLNIQFTLNVVVGGKIINMFPNVVKPFAGRFLTRVPKAIRTGMKHLRPIIEERMRKMDDYGPDYPNKPNDMLSWLLDQAEGKERSIRNLTLSILSLNFAAIQTSSMSFTHALFHLAARLEYVQPIREEAEAVVAQYGWTKNALTHMRKLDSFIKESQRIEGVGGVTMSRKAMRDYTFSDGTHIPKGGFVSVGLGVHFDGAKYADATTFDGFRFSNMKEEEGDWMKNQMVTASPEYMAFGYGKHACPGRFFAANEMKAMMAHLLLNYDMKLGKEGVRPENQWFGALCTPNPNAEVLFRKRRT